MARHEFNDIELVQYQSANAYRDEIEKRERRRDEQENKIRDKKKREEEYKNEQRIIDQHKRSEMRKNPIASEKQSASIGSDLIVGMAMMIASTAAEASYNKKLMEAQKDYQNDYAEAMSEQSIKQHAQEIREEQRQTLSEYNSRVEDARNNLESTRQSYYVEFQDIKKDAQQAISAANAEYDQKEKETNKTIRSIENSYQKEIDSIEKNKEDAAKDRDANIEYWHNKRDGAAQEYEQSYQRQVESINKEYSGEERENKLAAAKEEHESRLKQNKEYFDGCADAELTKYAMAINKCNEDAKAALEVKNASIDRCKDKLSEFEEKKNDLVNHQNEIIQAAQSKYVDAVREAKSNAQDAIVVRDALQGAISASNSSQLAAARITEQFNTHSVIVSGEKAGSGAERFMDSVNKSHARLGNDLACVFGSKEEVDLLNKVNADKAAKAEAKRSGIEAPLSLATKEDYEAAAKIEKKYAGNIDSEKGLKESIKTLNDSLNALNEKQNMLSVKIAEKNKEIAQLNAQITGAQKRIESIAADKQLLAIGRNADGTKLTVDQRGKIEARIQANGGMAANQKQLTALMTQKNAAMNAVNGLMAQVNGNKALIAGTKTHLAQLEKNGKAILHAKDKVHALGEKGFGKMYKSATILQKKFNDATLKGNVFHAAKEKRLKNMKKMGQRYELTLKYSAKVVRIMQVGSAFVGKSLGNSIKFIGSHTRLGNAMSAKYQQMRTKLQQNKRFQKASAKFQQGKAAVGKFAGKAVRAPLKILQAPERRQKEKRKRAEAAFRTTRKTAGRVTGYIGRQVSKPLNAVKRSIGNKIKSNGLYQRASARVNLVKDRAKSMAKNIGKKLLSPFAKAKAVAAKIWAAILSAISTVTSAILAFLSSLLSFAFTIFFILIIAIIAISLLVSIINAIVGFFKSLSVNHRALVANNPAYVINQAINYRSEELNIFELFVNAYDNPSVIEVSKSPVYYSLYYEESTGEKILNFFGIDTTEDRKLSATNTGARNLWNAILDDEKGLGVISFGCCTVRKDELGEQYRSTLKYDSVRLSYYIANDLPMDSDGNYILEGATASQYEVSNAKDVLALVDALYTKKDETMQKMEVLSYLGVGDYQLGYKDQNGDPTVVANNLFWSTHKFIYTSGNKNEDITFCETTRIGESYDYHVVGCDNVYYYDYTALVPVTREVCQGHTVVHEATYDKDGNSLVDSACDNYTEEPRVLKGQGNNHKVVIEQHCKGHTYTHESSHSNAHGDKFVDSACDNKVTETSTKRQNAKFGVCGGHINLDLAIAVTLLKDDGKMFAEAAKVPGVSEDEYIRTKLWGGALISFDKENGVWGFGNAVHNMYDPTKDWAAGSEFRDLAIVKAQNDASYTIKNDKNVDEMTISISHYSGASMGKSLIKSSGGDLLCAVFVGDHKLYVKSLISGEQKELVYYINNNGSYGPDTKLVSFESSPYSGPQVYYPDED